MVAVRTPVVPAFTDDELTTSPIGRLPIELIGEVLLWCSEIDIQNHRRRSFFPSLPSITEVCSLWRNVAISTPNLWSNIMIYAPSERHIAMTKTFLERSKTSPLRIRIEHAAGKHSAELEKEHLEHDITDTLLHLLIPQLNRWKSIDFVFLHQTQLPLLSLPIESDAASLLEEVSMALKSWNPDRADLLWSTIHSYTSVKRVMWQGFIPSFGRDCYIPWAQLTDVSINFPDVDTCFNILRQCHSLQSLDATFYCDSPSTLMKQEPIVLEKLETLQISTRIELGVVFDNLALPALKHLDINRTSTSSTDADKLLDLLVRSGCRIESFSFTAQDSSDREDTRQEDELTTYLTNPLFSSLLSLELNLPFNTAAIKLLTHRTSDDGQLQYLLPHVTSMFLSIGVPDDETEAVEEEVMKMFASRIDYSVGQYCEFGHEIYQV